MSRVKIIFAAMTAAALLAGCGSSGSPDGGATEAAGLLDTPGAGSDTGSAPVPPPASTPVTHAPPAPGGDGDSGPDDTGSQSSATPSEPGSPSAPGGQPSSKSRLRSAHLLDDSGRLLVSRLHGQDASITIAACRYVFGTADQVGATSRIGKVTLTSAGTDRIPGAFTCMYATPSAPQAFVIGAGSSAMFKQVAAVGKGVVSVSTGSWTIALGYGPGYSGPMISAADGKAWLAASRKRIARP